MRLIPLAATIAMLSAPVTAVGPQDAKQAAAKEMSATIATLASDEFQGRSADGGPGEQRTLAFLVARMRAAGLQPAGEKGGWLQDVPLARFTTPPTEVEVMAGGNRIVLHHPDDITLQMMTLRDRTRLDHAPLVFVGYGVSAPERGWNDFKGVDLHGKIAVCLVNDPDYQAAPGEPVAGRFGGKAMTYYGRWSYKFEEAARRGALGLIIIHETLPAGYGWDTVSNSTGRIPQFDIVRDNPAKVHPPVQGWIRLDAMQRVLTAAGIDFAALKRQARAPDFRPVPLPGVTMSATIAVDHTVVVSHNVLGKIPGKRHPDEILLYTAHWDHLGFAPPMTTGTIFHGALDNASGVAGMLQVARLFAAGPAPDRTVVFLAPTAEERGFLGSEFYATHPLYPLAKTVADINLDILTDAGPARDISFVGLPQNDLADLLEAEGRRSGRYLSADPDLEKGFAFRGDHFSLEKGGVPSIWLRSGRDLIAGGKAAGDKAADAYNTLRYHQPADRWSPAMNTAGMVEDAGLAYRLGRTLADGDLWPQWKTGSEFAAVRDASRAARR